jgi:hypothetical protein
MLESTGGGLDQSAATRKRRHCSYVGDGCLTGGRGVIFPGSYRFSGTFHALKLDKYADRFLGAFCYRFNRRFNLEEMTGRILLATCNCTARPERLLRAAELGA